MSKKTKPFYLELAEHIQEIGTFDLNENEGQYPNIHWLIARSMLDDFSEFDRHQLLTYRAGQVKRAFEHALSYLKQQGIIVYRSRGDGKRNIEFISTDPNFEDCKAWDWRRQKSGIQSRLESFSDNVRTMHPDKVPMIAAETKRFNNKLLSMGEE